MWSTIWQLILIPQEELSGINKWVTMDSYKEIIQKSVIWIDLVPLHHHSCLYLLNIISIKFLFPCCYVIYWGITIISLYYFWMLLIRVPIGIYSVDIYSINLTVKNVKYLDVLYKMYWNRVTRKKQQSRINWVRGRIQLIDIRSLSMFSVQNKVRNLLIEHISSVK